jgi:hypothetical protein
MVIRDGRLSAACAEVVTALAGGPAQVGGSRWVNCLQLEVAPEYPASHHYPPIG